MGSPLPLVISLCGENDASPFADESGGGALRRCTATPVSAQEGDSLGAGRAFLYSIAVPGVGQRALGRRRWFIYSLVEAAAWLRWLDRKDLGSDVQRQYRDFAWNVARTQATQRVDGDFEYYESLGSFESSGALDMDPLTDGVQPEVDSSTFNGRIWNLAKEIFFVDGEGAPPGSAAYEAALAYYLDRSVGEAFLWSWTGRPFEKNSYEGLIRRSDEARRAATGMVGVVLINHLASGIDAFLSRRLWPEEPDRLELGVYPGRFDVPQQFGGWTLSLRLAR